MDEEASFEAHALEQAIRMRSSLSLKVPGGHPYLQGGCARTLGSYSPTGNAENSPQRAGLSSSGDKKVGLGSAAARSRTRHHTCSVIRRPHAHTANNSVTVVCKEIGADPARLFDVEGLEGSVTEKRTCQVFVPAAIPAAGAILRKRKTAIVRCRCGARYQDALKCIRDVPV